MYGKPITDSDFLSRMQENVSIPLLPSHSWDPVVITEQREVCVCACAVPNLAEII